MTVDAFRDQLGQAQCFTCFAAVHRRLSTRGDTVEEFGYLVGEAVLFRDLDGIEIDRGKSRGRWIAVYRIAFHPMIGEIADDVAIGLENANSPLRLVADPARGDRRDAGRAEYDSGIRQIRSRIDHRHAHGVHCRCRQADEPLYEVDVVDHQVENDVDLSAPVLPR